MKDGPVFENLTPDEKKKLWNEVPKEDKDACTKRAAAGRDTFHARNKPNATSTITTVNSTRVKGAGESEEEMEEHKMLEDVAPMMTQA